MDKKTLGKYMAVGLTALAVVAISLLIGFLLVNLEGVTLIFVQLINILMPFIIGAVLAYLLAPVYNVLCRNLDYYLSMKLKPRRSKALAKGLSVTLSVLLAIGLVGGLVALVVPELVTSVKGLIDSLPAYIDKTGLWLDQFFQTYNIYGGSLQAAYDAMSESLMEWISKDLLPNLQALSTQLGEGSGMSSILGSVFDGVMAVFGVLKNVLIGVIVTIYLLLEKDKFAALSKKFLYAVLGSRKGNGFMLRIRYIHKVFGGFIQGKILDSFIIGVLCFIGTSLLQMPYTLLVSVIVGVTNVIPFFGPFIGAIPSAILILLADPIKCVYFIIFILALQQFDGNVLGPKILGDATGLSSFSVLFAILFFGGIFGFIGMIIGVPLFAVICSLVSELVNGQLRKKAMSLDTEDYRNLDYVEQSEQRYVKRKDPTEK